MPEASAEVQRAYNEWVHQYDTNVNPTLILGDGLTFDNIIPLLLAIILLILGLFVMDFRDLIPLNLKEPAELIGKEPRRTLPLNSPPIRPAMRHTKGFRSLDPGAITI